MVDRIIAACAYRFARWPRGAHDMKKSQNPLSQQRARNFS